MNYVVEENVVEGSNSENFDLNFSTKYCHQWE